MEGAVLEKSPFEMLGSNLGASISDPAGREESTEGTESPMFGWAESLIAVAPNDEEVSVFESYEAMRFGPRYYTDEQFERIRRATADRAEPPAPPIPLDQ